MSGRISAIVLTLLWLHSPIVFEQAHFKRFTETVTNNGAYVLGWGLKDDPAGSVDSKTEIVADGPEKIDIESIGVDVETFERIEDYLVDTTTGKIVATIPDFTYYAGSEGRENHFHLELAGRPTIGAVLRSTKRVMLRTRSHGLIPLSTKRAMFGRK